MRSSLKLVLAGAVILVGGVLPLVLYIAFGPADGNPIGLGLLVFVSVPTGGACLVAGLVWFFKQKFAERDQDSDSPPRIN